jgi:gliding motility-associated-like protein
MATGCVASGEVTVWLSSPPIVYDATITKVSAGVFTIEVFADGLGIYEYQLNDGPFQDSATFTNVELGPGAHYVTIRDKNGCGYVILELGIIDYPLYFTPNNDGYHDTWNIHGIGVVDPSATIYIFDRYGKLLKQLSPTGPGWDGTYNGQEMPSTDYWFRADYIENGARKQLKGHFTLKR